MLSHYRTRLMAPVLTALAAVCAPAYAAVVPDATHFHFSAKEQELTVRLSNQGGSPALVQAWIDDGDADSTPETAAAVPSVISPPVARINAVAEKV
uniref:fimbria/pilus periplasmic chaperone n=1 Tax=Stenotrophomonas maltophilia TaxID=40324 RepID=UPI00166072C0